MTVICLWYVPAVDGIGGVQQESRSALTAVAESAGQVAENTYDVEYYAKKGKLLKLKVGNQGLQLFDESGQKMLESWHYFKMDFWKCDVKLEKLTFVNHPPPDKKNASLKSRTFEFRTKEGSEMCAAMEKHAIGIVAAQQGVKDAAAKMAKELCGVYKIIFKHGALVRTTAELDSDQVAVVCTGEHVVIDEALPNFKGAFKTRLHIKRAKILVELPLPAPNNTAPTPRKITKPLAIGEKPPEKKTKVIEVSGWITMKSDKMSSSNVSYVERIATPDGMSADDHAASLVELAPEPEPEPGEDDGTDLGTIGEGDEEEEEDEDTFDSTAVLTGE
jgi:hypothetical protein